MEADYTIIGGGVVGLSIAWGLLKKGKQVLILDGTDNDFRASQGNFGLIWVQSKGLDQPLYVKWSQKSAGAWAGFASELESNTGHNLALEQNGGFDFHLSEETLMKKVNIYKDLKLKLGGNYPFHVLDNRTLRQEEPNIGAKVVGAILHDQDGHVNPLNLLRALVDDVKRLGGLLINGKQVSKIKESNGFNIYCKDGTNYQANKIVLAAGLGNIDLGSELGFKVPVRPQRGQVIITEKLPKIMNRPSEIARQVNEGGVQIGGTKDNVGFNNEVIAEDLGQVARLATDVYPKLAKAQLIRSWGALRVLSLDGLPVYQRSERYKNAFLTTCHSGITLAAAHAYFLPDWLENNKQAPDLEAFSEKRFKI